MLVRDAAPAGRWQRLVIALAVLACGLVGLLAPATASAMEYLVDTTADEADEDPGTGGCETANNSCTLRAAIEESNNSAVEDKVIFGSAFKGETGDTIALTLGIITINEPVVVEGSEPGQQCETSAAVEGPCVEVSGAGFDVESGEVVIRGLAITGAGTAVKVINASARFAAQNDWLGVKLDGSPGANATGIFLDPESDEATIGGAAATERNVIASNNNEGLDIEGASRAVIRGNYFGVAPDGVTQAPNAKDIEITDSTAGPGFKVEENEVGALLGAGPAGTAACDGGCNVISGATSTGIDLAGSGPNEAPASGPTLIHGNHIGLDASGTSAVANETQAVLVGAADRTVVGGSASGDANHINGGNFAVLAGEKAEFLVIEGNLIGLNAGGTAMLSPPAVTAIFSGSGEINVIGRTAEIVGNRISMLSGTAIEQFGTGALIAGNEIGRSTGGGPLSGGDIGIKLRGDDSFISNTVESNVIEESGNAGIVIENDNNAIVGNEIVGAGVSGVAIRDFLTLASTGNSIGEDATGGENVISGSGGDAIEVQDPEDDDTHIFRNRGTENGGLFIDLGADGPGNKVEGPNNGIQAPTIASATESGASGSSLPKADIRVFRKASTSPGELQSFLGETTADEEGKWSLTYGTAIPSGTPIAATQSEIEGTSELAIATTAIPPSEEKGGGGGGGGTAEVDKTPPQTKILKGPKKKSGKLTAKFKFSSSEAGSSFECKLDGKPFKPCRSPKKYKKLKPGRHVFKVRAIDAAGNKDSTPAKRKFQVLG